MRLPAVDEWLIFANVWLIVSGSFLYELYPGADAELVVDVVRWLCMVRGDTKSRVAISLLASPSLTRRTTSRSVGVNARQPLVGRLRSPWPRRAYAIASSVDIAAPSAHALSKSLSPSASRTAATDVLYPSS